MMAYRLACEIPGKLSAIAPVSGQNIYSCPLVTPVPVIHIHGTFDLCALYDGGECGGCFGRALDLPIDKQWACESVRATLLQRAASYGCSPETRHVHQRGAVECEEWKDCPVHGEIGLCTVHGGGHHWQGSNLPAFCKDKKNMNTSDLCGRWLGEVGPILDGVDTNALIFGFFAGYLKR
jgi:polyhydroxybutyrate depolymerase